jgi:hypothetical protein
MAQKQHPGRRIRHAPASRDSGHLQAVAAGVLFIWTKTARDILQKVIRANARFSPKKNAALHWYSSGLVGFRRPEYLWLKAAAYISERSYSSGLSNNAALPRHFLNANIALKYTSTKAMVVLCNGTIGNTSQKLKSINCLTMTMPIHHIT